ncbi:Uncharacterised protein [Legionella donaldsonii]|uniref:Uncharacterized protein n=1 Tax=Legionella donaldsonii TaxID=45060 RepID=A0A378J6Y6_9GAMM|nr:Uncharacterised protein [Legionella donaldsonii]
MPANQRFLGKAIEMSADPDRDTVGESSKDAKIRNTVFLLLGSL